MQYDCMDYYDYYSGSDEGVHGCCLLCDDAEPGCLCYDCKCTRCYWYGHDGFDGYCELADIFKVERKEEYERGNQLSDKQIKNVVDCTSSAILCQVGHSNLIWIPLSVINKDGFVKNWFVEKFLNEVIF